MKRKNCVCIFVLSVVCLLALPLSGCSLNPADRDIMEEPEITVDYLSGEYADQLTRDGCEKILGTIHLQENDKDGFDLTVNSMVIVESSIADDGYYIADKNLSTTVPLDSEARVTYIADKKHGPEVIPLDKFIKSVKNDELTSSEEGSEKLYEVYIIGGNALMILAKELPDA